MKFIVWTLYEIFYANKNVVSGTETRCRTRGKTITVYIIFVLKRNYGDMHTSNNNTETDIKKIYI